MDESDIIRMHRKRIHTHRSRSLVDTRLLCDHFSQYPFYIWYSSLRIPSIKGTITLFSDFVNKNHCDAGAGSRLLIIRLIRQQKRLQALNNHSMLSSAMLMPGVTSTAFPVRLKLSPLFLFVLIAKATIGGVKDANMKNDTGAMPYCIVLLLQ